MNRLVVLCLILTSFSRIMLPMTPYQEKEASKEPNVHAVSFNQYPEYIYGAMHVLRQQAQITPVDLCKMIVGYAQDGWVLFEVLSKTRPEKERDEEQSGIFCGDALIQELEFTSDKELGNIIIRAGFTWKNMLIRTSLLTKGQKENISEATIPANYDPAFMYSRYETGFSPNGLLRAQATFFTTEHQITVQVNAAKYAAMILNESSVNGTAADDEKAKNTRIETLQAVFHSAVKREFGQKLSAIEE